MSSSERQALISRAETEVKTVIENEAAVDQTLTVEHNESNETTESLQLSQMPCIICNEEITCISRDSKLMVQHLEEKHRQRLCPVCSMPFDLTLPGHSDYFKMHVNNHFDAPYPQQSTASASATTMYP